MIGTFRMTSLTVAALLGPGPLFTAEPATAGPPAPQPENAGKLTAVCVSQIGASVVSLHLGFRYRGVRRSWHMRLDQRIDEPPRARQPAR